MCRTEIQDINPIEKLKGDVIDIRDLEIQTYEDDFDNIYIGYFKNGQKHGDLRDSEIFYD